MATTQVDLERKIFSDPDDFEDAYEVVDGVPIGRSSLNLDEVAYEEAYEIVDGQIQEWPEMGAYPQEIASILHLSLGTFVGLQGLGRAIIEPRFQMPQGRQRRPDLGFISFSKWPKKKRAPNSAAWDLVPNLAVEVVSKTDIAWDVLAKVREYFDAGVETVWLIYPNLETIHVYTSWSQIEVVTREQTLDGGAVIPGFRLPLADLFMEETELEPEQAVDPAV